jgi:two-component system, sporulation sensor kinase B
LGIQEFLLNMLFIILSIFAYQIFWADRIKQIQKMTFKKNQYLITILCGLSIILCITFPVSHTSGYYYDLRQIPLFLGALYGGNLIGLLLTALMIVYRFLLGGGGVINTILFYSVFIIITVAFRKSYLKYTLKTKLLTASIVIGSFSFFPIFLAQQLRIAPFPGEGTGLFLVVFSLLSVITVCLAIYLIERLIESVQLRMEIQQAEKMNVVGQLTASIAHEIRNPMTASRGFMQLLKEDVQDEKNLKYIQLAISEMDRAQDTISEYLSFAKPEIEEHENIDVNTHLSNVLSIIYPYAAINNVEIEADLQDGICVKGNPGKLTQCFVNLIKNAIEAASGKGNVTVTATNKESHVIIKITDNGVGMDDVQLKRLGTPFYSTKEKGTGLGVTVCYRIIEMMEGKIKVTSELGKGTCFSIILPAHIEIV